MSFILQNVGLAFYGAGFHVDPELHPAEPAFTIGGVEIQWNNLGVFALDVPLLLVLTWFVQVDAAGEGDAGDVARTRRPPP